MSIEGPELGPLDRTLIASASLYAARRSASVDQELDCPPNSMKVCWLDQFGLPPLNDQIDGPNDPDGSPPIRVVVDSPRIRVPWADTTMVSAGSLGGPQESFETHLMYRPDTGYGTWVPLEFLSWYWSETLTATNNGWEQTNVSGAAGFSVLSAVNFRPLWTGRTNEVMTRPGNQNYLVRRPTS